LTNKAADVATAHVLAGALSLLMGAMLTTAAVASAPCRSVQRSSSSSANIVSGRSLAHAKPIR
jgi:hypothetical protein